MFYQFLKRNRTTIIILVALLVLNLAALLLFTLPQLDANSVNQKRIETVQEHHAELQKILNERREFKDLMASNSESLQRFYNDILGTREERITSILAEREKMGNQFGISPTQVRYNFSTEKDMPLETFRMSFPLSGTYESFRFFVNTLENSDSFFIVDDIELASQQDNPDAMNMRIAVSTLFYAPEPRLRDGEEADE